MSKPSVVTTKTQPEIKSSNHGIALNVTRTRVTVLVFNLSIISFMFSILATKSPSADSLPHVSTSVALLMGFFLTLLGLWLLLLSQDWDEIGLSRPISFTLGTMTTYLALSQTVTAFVHEYLIRTMNNTLQTEAADTLHGFAGLSNTGLLMILIMGGVIWILITYIGPLGAIRKSQSREWRWLYASYYLGLQIPINWITAEAWYLQTDQSMNMLSFFALQFMQPLLWFR